MLKSYLKSVVVKVHYNPLQTVSARFVPLFVSFLLLTLLSCDNIINHISTNGCEETDSIGVWKFLGLANETVQAIAIHPQKPNIIYAGTGKDFSAGIPGRLYRSNDCGKSWKIIMEGADYSFTQILFDPYNSNVIYAIPHSLLKSTNGGLTWKDISNGIKLDWETRVSKIAIDPKNPDIIYAGTGGFFGGTLYKSTNGGISWKNLYRTEDETPGLRNGVISLAIDPVDNNTVYAGTADAGVVLKSTDVGYTWVVTGLGETGQLINSIEINELTHTIYVAISHTGFMRSLDSGSTWQSFNEGIADTVYGIKIIINPQNYELYGVASSNIGAGIFKKKFDNLPWQRIDVDDISFSSYSDIFITGNGEYLFFGTKGGLFKTRLK